MLVGHDHFFVFRANGQVQLVRDSCPHRGGPLSLGRLTADGRRLACPWHDTRVGVAAINRTALPMVRCGTEATVVLPATVAPQTPVSVIRREILANLPPILLAAVPEPDAGAGQRQRGIVGTPPVG